MIDGVASLMTSIFQVDASGEWDHQRGSNWLQGAAPWYRAYETGDGRFLTVGPLEPKFYELLLARLGLDPGDWPQHDRQRWPALTERLEEVFRSRTLSEWNASLEGTDVCYAPALTLDEVVEHPHLAARSVFVEHEGATQPAPVPRFGRTPGSIASPPPWPGQHSLEVLRELGVDPERSSALVGGGAVAQLATEEERA